MSDGQVQGTSIEDIEMGNIKNEADSEAMRQILSEMNVVETAERQQPGISHTPPAPEYRAMQPPQPQFAPQFAQQYAPRMQIQEYDQEYEQEPAPAPKYKQIKPIMKKNKWSELFDSVKEPLLVGLLVIVILFPKLHTLGSKYAPWAYTVGGQVGWVGLLFCFLFATGVWAIYKFFTN
jgi:hypothetical protein